MRLPRIILVTVIGIGGGAGWLLSTSKATAGTCQHCSLSNHCIDGGTTTCHEDCHGGICGCLEVSGCLAI